MSSLVDLVRPRQIFFRKISATPPTMRKMTQTEMTGTRVTAKSGTDFTGWSTGNSSLFCESSSSINPDVSLLVLVLMVVLAVLLVVVTNVVEVWKLLETGNKCVLLGFLDPGFPVVERSGYVFCWKEGLVRKDGGCGGGLLAMEGGGRPLNPGMFKKGGCRMPFCSGFRLKEVEVAFNTFTHTSSLDLTDPSKTVT